MYYVEAIMNFGIDDTIVVEYSGIKYEKIEEAQHELEHIKNNLKDDSILHVYITNDY